MVLGYVAWARHVPVQLLAGLGATDIDSADNGADALTQYDSRERPPDLLLIDLSMPEMGGVTLMKNLADRDYSGAVVASRPGATSSPALTITPGHWGRTTYPNSESNKAHGCVKIISTRG